MSVLDIETLGFGVSKETFDPPSFPVKTQSGCDSHMGSFFIWHILSPIETFAKVEAMSESRSIEDLPIVICCSFEWIPVFS